MRDNNEMELPPDEFRCSRSDGKKWRCKGWRFEGNRYCQYHNNKVVQARAKKQLYIHQDDDDDEEDKQVGISNKRTHANHSEEEGEDELEIPLKKKSRTTKGVPDYERLKIKREEAEKSAAELKEELEIYETICGDLSNELEAKKREIITVEGKYEELELKKICFEDEAERLNKMCTELKEKVTQLENDLEMLFQQERQSQERFTKMTRDERERIMELKAANWDLESAKRRAENETEIWKRKFKQLETKLLLETPVSRSVHVEPRNLLGEFSCVREAMNGGGKQTEITNYEGKHASMPPRKIKEEALNCDGCINAFADVDSISHSFDKKSIVSQLADDGKKSGSRLAKTLEGTTCENTGLLLPAKIKKEPMNCDWKVCISASEESIPHSTVKEISTAKFAEERRNSERTQARVQSETSYGLNSSCLPHLKIKEEAFNCEERAYSSVVLDSISPSLARGSGITQLADSEVEKGICREPTVLQLDRNSCKNLSPPPGFSFAKPTSKRITQIINSNDKMEETPSKIFFKETVERSGSKRNGEEKWSRCEEQFSSTPKTKCVSRVITCSSHDEADQNPIKIYNRKRLDGHTFGVDSQTGSFSKQHCAVPDVPAASTRIEKVKEPSPSRKRLMSLRQLEEKRSGNVQVLPDDHVRTAKRDNGKEEVEEFTSEHADKSLDRFVQNWSNASSEKLSNLNSEKKDGVSILMAESRRLKANELKCKGSSFVVD